MRTENTNQSAAQVAKTRDPLNETMTPAESGDMNDTERLDYLESITKEGSCPGLINDDNGHWAVAEDGVQNCPMGDEPVDIQTTFFIEAKDWHPTIREAIDAFASAR